MIGNFCQNCGHESHCGGNLLKEFRNWKEEHMGQIEVCKMCRCSACAPNLLSDDMEIPHPGDIGC